MQSETAKRREPPVKHRAKYCVAGTATSKRFNFAHLCKNCLFRLSFLLYNYLVLYLLSILLVLVNVVWLVLVVFGLPGNWLIVISTCLFTWWRWEDGIFSIYTLVAIVVLAIIGELFELFGGMRGARKSGASWAGSVAALAGAITGAILGTFFIPIPFLGTLLGACIGAGLGAWALEFSSGKELKESARHAVGAGLGEFLGITSKLAIGIIIWFIVTIAAFWP